MYMKFDTHDRDEDSSESNGIDDSDRIQYRASLARCRRQSTYGYSDYVPEILWPLETIMVQLWGVRHGIEALLPEHLMNDDSGRYNRFFHPWKYMHAYDYIPPFQETDDNDTVNPSVALDRIIDPDNVRRHGAIHYSDESVTVDPGVYRHPPLDALQIAELLHFLQTFSDVWHVAIMAPDFYIRHLRHHLTDLPEKNPLEWATRHLKIILGYAAQYTEKGGPPDFFIDVWTKAAKHVCSARNAVQPISIPLTQDDQLLLKNNLQQFPSAVHGDIVIISNALSLDLSSIDIHTSAFFQSLPILLEHGLRIDQFITIAQQKSFHFSICFFSTLYAKEAPWWFMESTDLSSALLHNDEETLFYVKKIGYAYPHLVALFRATQGVFDGISGISNEERQHCYCTITEHYGIGNTERAQNIIRMLVQLLHDTPEAERSAAMSIFLHHTITQAPESIVINMLEGNTTSLAFPGLLPVIAHTVPSIDHKTIDELALPTDVIDHLVARFEQPAHRRDDVHVALLNGAVSKPLLPLSISGHLTHQTTQDDQPRKAIHVPGAQTPVIKMMHLYALVEEMCKEKMPDTFWHLYFTYIAPHIADPFNPDQIIVQCLLRYIHIPHPDYEHVFLEDPRLRDRREEENAQYNHKKYHILSVILRLVAMKTLTENECHALFLFLTEPPAPADYTEEERQHNEREEQLKQGAKHWKSERKQEIGIFIDHYTSHIRDELYACIEQSIGMTKNTPEHALHAEKTMQIYRTLGAQRARMYELWQRTYCDRDYCRPQGRRRERIEQRRRDRMGIVPLNDSCDSRYRPRSWKTRNYRRRRKESMQRNVHEKNRVMLQERMKSMISLHDVLDVLCQLTNATILTPEQMVNISHRMLTALQANTDDMQEWTESYDAYKQWKSLAIGMTSYASCYQQCPDSLRSSWQQHITFVLAQEENPMQITRQIFSDIDTFCAAIEGISQHIHDNPFSIDSAMEIPYGTHKEKVLHACAALLAMIPWIDAHAVSEYIDYLLQSSFKEHGAFLYVNNRYFTNTGISTMNHSNPTSSFVHRNQYQSASVVRRSFVVAHGIEWSQTNLVSENWIINSQNLPMCVQEFDQYLTPHMERYRAGILDARQKGVGLLPLGAKIHVRFTGQLNAEQCEMAEKLLGVGSCVFALHNSNTCLTIPPTLTVTELQIILSTLVKMKILNTSNPEVQICAAGRLPEYLVATLATTTMLCTDVGVQYDEHTFQTNQPNATGLYLMVYDADAPNLELPYMLEDITKGRTDMLCRRSFYDAEVYQYVHTVLMHVHAYHALRAQGRPTDHIVFAELGVEFMQKQALILRKYGLQNTLNAPWIKPKNTIGEDESRHRRHFHDGIVPCMHAHQQCAKNMTGNSATDSGIIVEMRALVSWLQKSMKPIQTTLHSHPYFAQSCKDALMV